MMASILGLKRSHAHCNVELSMPTNAASIAILNDVTLGYRDLFDPFNYAPYVVVQGSGLLVRMGAKTSNLACPDSLREQLSYL